jgi:hypothetical protein
MGLGQKPFGRPLERYFLSSGGQYRYFLPKRAASVKGAILEAPETLLISESHVLKFAPQDDPTRFLAGRASIKGL